MAPKSRPMPARSRKSAPPCGRCERPMHRFRGGDVMCLVCPIPFVVPDRRRAGR